MKKKKCSLHNYAVNQCLMETYRSEFKLKWGLERKGKDGKRKATEGIKWKWRNGWNYWIRKGEMEGKRDTANRQSGERSGSWQKRERVRDGDQARVLTSNKQRNQ